MTDRINVRALRERMNWDTEPHCLSTEKVLALLAVLEAARKLAEASIGNKWDGFDPDQHQHGGLLTFPFTAEAKVRARAWCDLLTGMTQALAAFDFGEEKP